MTTLQALSTPRLLALALSVALLGCPDVRLPAKKKPGVPVATFEVRGRLSFDGSLDPISLSTAKQRFRWEHKGKVFVGSLTPADDSVLVLDPEAETFFRHATARHTALKASAGSQVAARYKRAMNASGGAAALNAVRWVLSTPCELATASGVSHVSCSFAPTGAPGLQEWTHTETRRSVGSGVIAVPGKRQTYTSTILYDTTLGIVTSARTDRLGGHTTSRSLGSLEHVQLDASQFAVPTGYTETLSDAELQELPALVGSEDMLEGFHWTAGKPQIDDVPNPPAATEWTILRQTWYGRRRGVSDSSQNCQVIMTSATPRTPSLLSVTPLKLSHEFNVPAWDPVASAGDRSYQPKDTRELVFTANGKLVKVRVANARSQDLLLPLCEAIARR